MKALRSLILACSLLTLAPSLAGAQTPEAEVQKLLRRAIGDYDNLDLDRAMVSLQAAITVANVHKLRGPIVGQCYLRMGLIQVALNKDAEAIQSFVKAIQAHPGIKPDAAVMNPRATAAFEKARTLAPPPPPPPPTEADFTHREPSGADEGKEVSLAVDMAKPRKGLSLAIRYRSGVEAEYAARDLAEDTPGHFTVSIPGAQIRPPELTYFFQVRDDQGKLVLTLGSAERPHRVAIKKAPPKVNESDFLHIPPNTAEEDRSLRVSVQMPQRKTGLTLVVRYRSPKDRRYERRDLTETVAGEFSARIPARAVVAPEVRYFFEVQGEGGQVLLQLGSARRPYRVSVRPALPPPPPPPPPSTVGGFRLFIGVGASLGVVGGTSDSFKQEIKRGTAFGPFHTSFEVGYAVTPNLELGLNARIQLAPGTTFGVEPRVRWLPLNTGTIRPYAQFGVPIMNLRYNVDLRPVRDNDDTVTAGVVGIGIGGGVAFLLGKRVTLALEVNTITIFPDTTFAVDFGLRAGFRF